MSTQEGVGILISPQLPDYMFDWIRLGSRACMLKLKVNDRSLCLLQVYVPNAVSEYQVFVDDVNDALQRVGSTESTILSGEFNAHIETDSETWKSVIFYKHDFIQNSFYKYEMLLISTLITITL